MTNTKTSGFRKEHPPSGIRKAIAVIKEAVTIGEYAATLTELRGANGNPRGRCPVHGGDNPQSFAVYPDEGRWHCFRCNQGGDLIDLCELVEKHADTWTAVVSLSIKFNVELPQRPERWHARQDDKARVRAAAKKHLARCYQRRLTRVYAPLVLLGGETTEEGLEELEELATALWPIALDMATRRLFND